MDPELVLTADAIRQALWDEENPEKAAFFPRFFKSGPGEYGEGDKFIGVTVPIQRGLAKRFKDVELDQLKALLEDEYHECRLTALLILNLKYKRAKTPEKKEEYCQFYLDQLDRVNNWDLVDTTAYKILGPELLRLGDLSPLDPLANSGHLWRERVAVMATLALIKEDQFGPTLALCEKFLGHEHDLIHKATGWMLREIGKRDKTSLEEFLSEHSQNMPRTMLRYAIEKLPKAERDRWMGR